MIVEYSHNNSGGGDWLEPKDWKALTDAGWKVELFGQPWVKGERASSAEKEFDSVEDAIAEWTRLTGACHLDEGCECCGPPHYFGER